MISTKLTRAAHRAAAAAPTPSTACYACLSQQRSHQRRPSSSKASSSADGYSAKPATPAAKSTAPAADEEQSAAATRGQQRAGKGKPRREYRRVQAGQDGKKSVSAEATDHFAALPSVPSVQNLSESDRSVSNFFSLHRPMSITHTFPPPSTAQSFSKIFSTEGAQDAWADGNSAERRPEDVIYTLHTTIETLENGVKSSQDEGVRWEIMHESPSNNTPGVHHLDGQPRMKSLEDLVAQFKPFRAPPPPQPFPEYEVKSKSREKKSAAAQRQGAKPKQKTFTTTIIVTESTYANGQKTYSASSSPIVALAEPEPTRQARDERAVTRRERVRKLRQAGPQQAVSSFVPIMRTPGGVRGQRVKRMYLISVKRQRRLKMKKHKYKKLMKRTRNLRRRLERN